VPKSSKRQAEIICEVCGKPHPADEIELVFRRPDPIAALSSRVRAKRCKEDDDLCALWGERGRAHRYFVRGVIPLPVIGREVGYQIGAWAEVQMADFDRIRELWDDQTQSEEPPMTGRLANRISLHEAPTLDLNVTVHLTGPKTRPHLMAAERDHTLFKEQAEGVTAHRAAQYTGLVNAGWEDTLRALLTRLGL